MGDVVAEQVTGPIAEHGEGPVWWPDRGALCWVDLLAGDVLVLDDPARPRDPRFLDGGPGLGDGRFLDGGVRRWHVGAVAAALRPREGDGAVLAVERGFALADELGGPVRPLPPVWTDQSIRMNDGGCDPDGRFYCGSMAYDTRPGAGSLHRLDPDGTTHEVLTGVTVSNGFGFSPDGTRAYYIDTPTSRIDVFDYDTDKGLHDRRPLTTVEPPGLPDGLTVDAEGCVWVALWEGSAVRRYRPDGTLDAVLELPATHVTACAFGGPDLDRLYVTTSRQGVDQAEQPEAGSLFSFAVGVPGLPPLPFKG